MKPTRTLWLAALFVIGTSCGSTRYKDAQDEETLNADWSSTDVQVFSQAMVDSFLQSPNLSYLARPDKGDDQRIRLVMGGVTNETTEHINTEMIVRSVRTSLLQSGKFRIMVDELGQEEIGEQVRFQQGSGRVDPATAMAFGKQYGAEVVVYGSLASIKKRKGRQTDNYYQFVMNAVNVETGELLWSDEDELRKRQIAGLFGSG